MSKSRTSVWAVLGHLLPAFLLCTVFATVGILHVSSRVLVVRTGYALSALQAEHRTLTRENDRLRLELATLKSPSRLERTARERLGMGPPEPGEVISVLSVPRLGRAGPEKPRPDRALTAARSAP